MKNKFFKVFYIILLLTLIITNVNAKELVVASEDVEQTGKYDSIRFVFGKTITNKADVDGLSIIAGEVLTLDGKTPYGFYAGRVLSVSENVLKDVFVAGDDITLTEKALVGRDAFIAGNNVKIKAVIQRDLRLGASSVDLSGATIKGNANVDAEEIKLDDNTKILGTLTYSEDTKISGLSDKNAKNVEVTKAKEVTETSESISDIVIEKVTNFIMSTARAFIVMIILLWLLPKLNNKIKDEEFELSNVVKTSLIGLGTLIVIPIVSLIALFTGLLSSLSLIIFAVYAVSLYLSSIFVYYIVGNYIDEKFIKKDNMYLSLICGILLVKLIALIPILGGIISFVTLLYGLGIILNYINSLRKEN